MCPRLDHISPEVPGGCPDSNAWLVKKDMIGIVHMNSKTRDQSFDHHVGVISLLEVHSQGPGPLVLVKIRAER
jgi:hypothetical protein